MFVLLIFPFFIKKANLEADVAIHAGHQQRQFAQIAAHEQQGAEQGVDCPTAALVVVLAVLHIIIVRDWPEY